MARKKGQTYTAKQKTKVVLELLKEEKTINQLATEFNVTSINTTSRDFTQVSAIKNR